MDWRNRIVGSGEKRASQFVPHPLNWRVHRAAQRAVLQGLLTKVGWVLPVVENKESGFLLDGHERVASALLQGDQLVPFVQVSLSLEEEAAVLRLLDPIGEMAGKDNKKLAELRDSLLTGDEDLAGLEKLLSAEKNALRDAPLDLSLEEELAARAKTLAQDTDKVICPKCGFVFRVGR